MVRHQSRRHPGDGKLGDIAVDGLLYGLVAGAAMIAGLLFLEWASGAAPITALTAFDASRASNPVNGLFSHLAVSAVYGILWALLVGAGLRRLPVPLWVTGLVFGLALYGVALVIVVPNTDVRSVDTTVLLVAHLIYGLILGLLTPKQ